MKPTNEQTPPQRPKRETWTIDPPPDLKRMVARALKNLGAKPGETRGLRTRIVVDCIRIGMQSKGLARKKDLAQ